MEGTGGVKTTPSTEPLVVSPPSRLRDSLKLSKHFTLLFSWLWTIIFLVVLIIFVKAFEQKNVMTPTQKNTFNLLSTALIVILSLSFYECFKGFAKSFQPRLARWYNLSPDIAHKTEGFDNLLVVSSLLFHRVSWAFWSFCAVWILMNMIAQMAAAVISITYTVDDAQDFSGTYLRNGNVAVKDLRCYLHAALKDCPFQVTQDQLAHAYGEVTQGPDTKSDLECGYFSNLDDVINSKYDFPYYCRRNTTNQEFAYRFNEYNPDDTQKIYPSFTKRVIRASSGRCTEYSEIGSQRTTVGDSFPNTISALNFTYTDGQRNGTILIPTSALGREGTTYIYQGPRPPAEATTYGFGPRGIVMWVYRNPGAREGSQFFECPVTVEVVTNVRNPIHNISDSTARQAAASIALQGQFRNAGKDQDFTQWQWYADGHPWEVHYQNASRVGANIAEHAIVSLAQMVERNPTIMTPGLVPYLGSKLSVRWKYFITLLACIIAVDTLLIALSIYFLETETDKERGSRRRQSQSQDEQFHLANGGA